MRPVRLLTIPTTLALALACDPPVDTNEAPLVRFLSPVPSQVVDESPDVSASVEVTDIDGDVITVTVTADGTVALGTFEGIASGDTIDVPLGDLDGGEHVLSAVASDGTDDASTEVTFTWNLAPSAPEVEILPSAPRTADDLTVNLVTPATDPEGTAQIVYEYAWKRSSDGATASGETLPRSMTEEDDEWTVTVRAWESPDGTSHLPEAAYSEGEASVVIGNTPPTAPAAVSIAPNDPLLVNDLYCYVPDPMSLGGTDEDPADKLSYTTRWELNGTVNASFDGLTYLPASEVVTGRSWTCTLATTDGEDTSIAVESAPVLIGSDVRSAADAAARISGDNPDQHVGEVALGVDLDDEFDGQDDDLVLGIDDFTVGIDPNPSGLVAVFGGGDVASALLGARSYSLIGDDQGWPIGGRMIRVADIVGDAGEDLAFTRHTTSGNTFAGLVYVVPGNTLTASANAPFGGVIIDGDADIEFGSALAAGNVDGDPLSELFIGDGGAAYMYLGSAVEQATSLEKGDAVKQFGDVAGSPIDLILPGDFDGDGSDEVLFTTSTATGDTIGYVFTSDSLKVNSTYALADADVTIDDDVDSGEQAGISGAVLGDIDEDGLPDFVLGNPGHRNAGLVDVGWVTLFHGGSTFGSTDLALSASDVSIEGLEAGARFGASIVALGSVGDDDLTEFAIAAPNATVGPFAGAGIVYLFAGRDFTDGALAATTDRDASYARAEVTGEDAGDALSISGPPGDFDRDGISDLVFGAPLWNALDFGRTYVFLSGE